jgi:DNA-binding NarL/FixJ family response regulator
MREFWSHTGNVSLRILILEDDSFARAALQTSLGASGFVIIESTSSVSDAIATVNDLRVDVALIDVDLGTGPTGLDFASWLARRHPNVGLVILTSTSDPRLVRDSLPEVPEHAVYLVKSSIEQMSQIATAIFQAHENALSGQSDDSTLERLTLTDIQVETLRLVAEGHSNREIAKLRVVTEKAVEQTISKIAKALGITQTSTNNQRVHIARMYFRLRGHQ